jgi:hypothetical protein
MNRPVLALTVVCACLGFAKGASSQGFSTSASKPRPWSRVSFFTNSSRTDVDGAPSTDFSELTTAFTYQLPDVDESGADYGVDIRYATSAPGARPDRVSIYEGFAGARLAGGTVKFRVGHVWLNDLGSLGSLAGGLFEVRQKRLQPENGRFRVGVFGGLEPNILDAGYAPHVKKFGGYLGYDGAGARRHSVGYVTVRDGSLTERSVVTTTNFLPVGRKLFVYQAAEYDVQAPAGRARKGLAYFFSNVRVTPTDRVDVQGTYNRGRSIDARSLGEDILSGRPIAGTSLDGLLYESVGGRLTVEPIRRVRVYAGYSRDKNNRDTEPTARTLIGGYASNVGGSGLDVSASDSLMDRTTGRYHSRYVSLGRQFGRGVYFSGDYSTSLSVIRFSRSDGITIETRPHMTRSSGTATINLARSVSLLATVERTRQDQIREFRVLAGLTYRLR